MAHTQQPNERLVLLRSLPQFLFPGLREQLFCDFLNASIQLLRQSLPFGWYFPKNWNPLSKQYEADRPRVKLDVPKSFEDLRDRGSLAFKTPKVMRKPGYSYTVQSIKAHESQSRTAISLFRAASDL